MHERFSESVGRQVLYDSGSSEARRRRRIELALILSFWTLFALLTAGNRILDSRSDYLQTGLWSRELLRIMLTYAIWAVITPVIFWICRNFSIERSRLAPTLLLHIALAVLTPTMTDLYGDWLRALITSHHGGDFQFNPLQDLFRLGILNELVLYLGILATGFALEYFRRYRARRDQTIRLQAQLAEARLQALRMQINPHFLFNTLHAISALVERDPQSVRRMISRLSALLRKALDSSEEQEVPLENELSFLDDYFAIMQIRYQGRLQITQEVDPGVRDALVPNLVLQPLVENAIEHGFEASEGPGRLEVTAQRRGERLLLTVQDNGPGMSGDGMAREIEGIGLRNVRARLEQLYGDDQALRFKTVEGGGLLVEMELPYHTQDDFLATVVTAN